MNRLNMTPALTVYNRPFFVNELLAAIRPEVITPEMFAEMVEASRTFDRNTILTAAIRQVDSSGLIPNLAGTCTSPQDVLEMLTNLGHKQLLNISRLDPELQKEIFETLNGSHDTTLRALLVLDECQREVISQLVEIRQASPMALAVRQATEEALVDLYKNPKKLHSPTFDQVLSQRDRAVLLQGEPRICYAVHSYEGGVVEVWQYYFMPPIHEIHLPHPYQRITVGEIVEALTPLIYKRQLTDNNLYRPQTPSGFMGLLGKVGGAFPRLIAAQARKNKQIREQLMREENLANTLYELFSR